MSKRTFSILGDSISTFSGYNPEGNEIFYPREGYDVTLVDHTWWAILAKRMGLSLTVNEAYSGSRISRTGIRPLSSCFIDEKRQRHLGGDLIIVFGGTNDWGQADQPTTLEIFRSAYRDLVEAMTRAHSTSALFFCTPLQRTERSLTTANINGWTQLDLAEAIREVVADYPEAHLIDLASYPIRAQDGLLVDGVHPGRKGMEIVASLMQAGIEGR